MSAYFDGIKVGDHVYRLNDPASWEVEGFGNGLIFLTNGVETLTSNYYGCQYHRGNIAGQFWFWQPVHIDAPPRPKRWKKITLVPISETMDYFKVMGGISCSGNSIAYHHPINCRNYQHPTCEVEE
jgi:hypothetical protein